jgi:hypothetical protein
VARMASRQSTLRRHGLQFRRFHRALHYFVDSGQLTWGTSAFDAVFKFLRQRKALESRIRRRGTVDNWVLNGSQHWLSSKRETLGGRTRLALVSFRPVALDFNV